MFDKLPNVPTSQELLDKAFRRATRSGKAANHPDIMIRTLGNVLSDNLANLVRKFPSFEHLPPFYFELVDILVGVDKMRISLSRLGWANKQIRTISKEATRIIKDGQETGLARRQAIGRMASVIKAIEPDLLFLIQAKNTLRRLPTIEPNLPTIIVVGYPNVGKSSFVSQITSARPEVASYPFTTQGIIVGHFLRDNRKYQVVDTPGLLDRPLSERNEIERQAIAALRHLHGVVVFIADPSGHCGFSLEEQIHVLNDLQSWISLPVLMVYNKMDLTGPQEGALSMSTLTGEGVLDVLERLVTALEKSEEHKNRLDQAS